MLKFLDLQTLPPEQDREVFAAWYDALEPGAAFILRVGRTPVYLLDLLEQRAPGDFEWRPLIDGPAQWQVLVARRKPGHPRHRQILEFMSADHRHIHRLLEQVQLHARAGEHEAMQAAADHLATALRKHIAMEEKLLFPVITAKLGTPRGPAAVLRDEHIQALHLLGDLLPACAGGDGRAVLASLESLDDLLSSHTGMEERILYAVTDLLLGPQERDELVSRCQRV